VALAIYIGKTRLIDNLTLPRTPSATCRMRTSNLRLAAALDFNRDRAIIYDFHCHQRLELADGHARFSQDMAQAGHVGFIQCFSLLRGRRQNEAGAIAFAGIGMQGEL